MTGHQLVTYCEDIARCVKSEHYAVGLFLLTIVLSQQVPIRSIAAALRYAGLSLDESLNLFRAWWQRSGGVLRGGRDVCSGCV